MHVCMHNSHVSTHCVCARARTHTHCFWEMQLEYHQEKRWQPLIECTPLNWEIWGLTKINYFPEVTWLTTEQKLDPEYPQLLFQCLLVYTNLKRIGGLSPYIVQYMYIKCCPFSTRVALRVFIMTTNLWLVLYKKMKERDHFMTNPTCFLKQPIANLFYWLFDTDISKNMFRTLFVLPLFATLTHRPYTSALTETDCFQSIKKRNRHILGSIFLVCFQIDFCCCC